MSRKRKLIRNSIIIVALFTFVYFFAYYFNGYYLSKEKCFEQIQNTLYLQDNIVLEEIQDRQHHVFVLMDEKDETFSFIRIAQSHKIFYESEVLGYHGNTNQPYGELRMKIQKDHSFDYYRTYTYHDAIVEINIFHRNDPNVSEVELTLNNGETVRLNNWKHDYIVYSYNTENQVDVTKTIKAYDSNNQLIEEVEYEKFFDHYQDETFEY